MRKNTTLLTLISCVVVISGCASYKSGPVSLREATQYSNVRQVDGVSVAAEALTDSVRIKEIFYEDLSEGGFIPIEVVIHNGSTNRILVQKDQIEVVGLPGDALRPTNVSMMIEEFEHSKMAYALLGFGIFSYMSAEDANKKMASDWNSKELPRELMVNPNRRASGFVYIKMPKDMKPTGMQLTVPVENLETKVISTVKIQL